MQATIRKATKEDLTAIHELVVELAIYEKEPHAVTATIKDYEQAFDEDIFEVLVAEINQEIVGMVFYYMTYSTWKGKMLYLEDFVVNEKFRKSGIGQQLYDALLEVGRQKKAVLVKWQVLDWNEPAIKFYKKNSAVFEVGWLTCKKYL